MPMNERELKNFLDSKTRPQSKSEFRSRFGSNREAAEYLYETGTIRNRNGELVSVNSLMRRFQSRGGRSQGESAAVYKEAGKSLPPRIEGNQLTVTVKGYQGTREREFTTTFKGPDAYAFADQPSYRAFFHQYGYNQDTVDMFEGDDSGALEDVSVS